MPVDSYGRTIHVGDNVVFAEITYVQGQRRKVLFKGLVIGLTAKCARVEISELPAGIKQNGGTIQIGEGRVVKNPQSIMVVDTDW